PIGLMRSHIDDTFESGGQSFPIFSRDCPEYEVLLPGGQSLWGLCNHFKSKGFGSPPENDAKRTRQANRVHDILQRFDLTSALVVVAGDLNDTPDSQPLTGLLQTANLLDVLDPPGYKGRAGPTRMAPSRSTTFWCPRPFTTGYS